jgi:mycothiol S-conjugate amidase
VYAYEHAGDQAYRPELGEPWQPLKLYYGAFARRTMITLWRLLKERGLEMPWRDEAESGDEEPDWGSPDDVVTTEIEITPYLDRKRASLIAHHTQIAPDDWWVTMPRDIQEIALSRESFARARSEVEAPEHETDLFEGIEGLRRPAPAGAATGE